ncbi:VOC family protein [Solirubrobacter soli]|uniref:VOC family protein n=1 Tax=Solirubrobacter soli TaxID=363832 RepID=UPI00041218C4|nr:VOC family protein [Solirubrobacter soli]
MHGQLAHFAFNADDVDASRSFYESVFGWTFENPYPAFFRTSSAGGAIGVVQGRRALLDAPTNGPEVTFSVDDLGVALAAVQAGGGRVLMPATTIDGVGDLAFVADPGGNVLGLMRFA